MQMNGKKELWSGCVFIAMFAIWTALVQCVDVQPVGQNGTDIGFAAFNSRFHGKGVQ